MKKKFLFLAAAAIALASCSKEEVVDSTLPNEDDTSAITFRASVENGSTVRGLEVVNGKLEKFYVTALMDMYPDDPYGTTWTPLFEDLLFFEKPDEKNTFISDPVFRWSNMLSLKFYAVAYQPREGAELEKPNKFEKQGEDMVQVPNIYGTSVYITGEQATIYNFEPQPEFKDQIDLVTATTQSKKVAPGASVGLNFEHVLSEVAVKAKNTSGSHRIMIKAIKFGNIDAKASYDLNENRWYDVEGKTSYTLWQKEDHSAIAIPDKEIDLTKSEDMSVGYAMLLPQGLKTWGKTTEVFGEPVNGKSQTDAQYIAVLIKIYPINPETGDIKSEEAVLFPLKGKHKVADEEGYGWAYIPFHVDKCPAWNKSYRYIYHLDFSKGAGYNEDGEQILPADIQFTASVGVWSVVDIYKTDDSADVVESGAQQGE